MLEVIKMFHCVKIPVFRVILVRISPHHTEYGEIAQRNIFTISIIAVWQGPKYTFVNLVDNRGQLMVQSDLFIVLYQHTSNNVDKLVEILIILTYNFPTSMFLLDSFCNFTSAVCFQ